MMIKFIQSSVLGNDSTGFSLVMKLPTGETEVYHSVFCRRADAEAFSERVNALGVSPLHIKDILEDSLP